MGVISNIYLQPQGVLCLQIKLGIYVFPMGLTFRGWGEGTDFQFK